jgi:U3 small nucleolar RNA-associated protein 7
VPKEVQKERREAAANATLSKKETERNTNAEKSRMKGKNRVSKRYRKKQQNVVDDKKMRANILKEEQKKKAKRLADGSGDGPEGGGVCRPEPPGPHPTHQSRQKGHPQR